MSGATKKNSIPVHTIQDTLKGVQKLYRHAGMIVARWWDTRYLTVINAFSFPKLE